MSEHGLYCEKGKLSHTPLPWKYEGLGMFSDSTGHLISFDMRTSQGKEDAAFITKAVNASDGLLDFAKWVASGAKGQGDHGTVECSWEFVMSEAKQAIAKAEGKASL